METVALVAKERPRAARARAGHRRGIDQSRPNSVDTLRPSVEPGPSAAARAAAAASRDCRPRRSVSPGPLDSDRSQVISRCPIVVPREPAAEPELTLRPQCVSASWATRSWSATPFFSSQASARGHTAATRKPYSRSTIGPGADAKPINDLAPAANVAMPPWAVP